MKSNRLKFENYKISILSRSSCKTNFSCGCQILVKKKSNFRRRLTGWRKEVSRMHQLSIIFHHCKNNLSTKISPRKTKSRLIATCSSKPSNKLSRQQTRKDGRTNYCRSIRRTMSCSRAWIRTSGPCWITNWKTSMCGGSCCKKHLTRLSSYLTIPKITKAPKSIFTSTTSCRTRRNC